MMTLELLYRLPPPSANRSTGTASGRRRRTGVCVQPAARDSKSVNPRRRGIISDLVAETIGRVADEILPGLDHISIALCLRSARSQWIQVIDFYQSSHPAPYLDKIIPVQRPFSARCVFLQRKLLKRVIKVCN